MATAQPIGTTPRIPRPTPPVPIKAAPTATKPKPPLITDFASI